VLEGILLWSGVEKDGVLTLATVASNQA